MSSAIGRHKRDCGTGPDVVDGRCPWCGKPHPVDSMARDHMDECPQRPEGDQ